jgi:hypothetical protein
MHPSPPIPDPTHNSYCHRLGSRIFSNTRTTVEHPISRTNKPNKPAQHIIHVYSRVESTHVSPTNLIHSPSTSLTTLTNPPHQPTILLLHPRPPNNIRLHHRRDPVPPHKRPSTPLRDHRLPLLRPHLGDGIRILDRLPDKKQRRRAGLVSRDFQERQRLTLYPSSHFGSGVGGGLFGGGVGWAVRSLS